MNNIQKYNSKEKIIVCLITSLIGLLTVFLTMFIASFILVVFEINLNYLSIFSSICLSLGSFLAGLLSGKKIGSGGIICGLMVSSFIFFTVFIISLIFDPAGITLNTLIHFVITLLSSLIGGILGVNKSSKIL